MPATRVEILVSGGYSGNFPVAGFYQCPLSVFNVANILVVRPRCQASPCLQCMCRCLCLNLPNLEAIPGGSKKASGLHNKKCEPSAGTG